MKYLIDFAALALLYALAFFRKWKSRGRDVLLVNSLIYLYLVFVLYFAMMPVVTSLPFILNHPYQPMNMTPFIDVLAGRGDFFRQVVLNVVMTLPFGFLVPLTRNRSTGFVRTVLLCFLMSLTIEVLQPFFNRHSDITDLITNTAGGVLGYSFYILFRPVTSWLLDRLKT